MAKSSNNILALGVGLNLDPLNQDIANAAKTAKEGMETIGDSIAGAGAKADKPLKETKDKLVSLGQQLRQARLDAQQLSQGGKELGDAFQASVGKAAALKDQIQAVDQAILANSTTMNNVSQPAFTAQKTGFNGMAMSINQLTREMPAFTYSMQTGFMAISNNIPMFVDQINMAKRANMDLVATGQPVKSVFSQVASSLFSMQTLMGVGITILTVYGAEIYNALVGHDKSAESIKKEAEEQKNLANAQDQAWNSLVRLNNERADASIAHNSIVALYTRTLKDGLDKDLQNSKIALANELLNNQKSYNERKINFQQANEAEKLIREFYANEAIRITDDFNKKEADKLDKANAEKLRKQEAYSKYLIDLNKFETQQIADANKLAADKAKLAPMLARLQTPMLPGLGASGYDFGKSKKVDLTLGFSIDQIKIAADMDIAAKTVTEKLKFINGQIKAIAVPGIVNALSGLGEGIAGALSGDNDPFEAFGIGLIKSLGAMAVQLGTQLLLIGAGLQIVPGLQYNASLYMLGGAALIVAGSAVSGLAGRKSQSTPTPSGGGGGGGNNSNPSLNSNYIGGNNSGKLVIEGYVRGNDINFVNGKSGSKNNRSLRFG
jgi:hypothetical protein